MLQSIHSSLVGNIKKRIVKYCIDMWFLFKYLTLFIYLFSVMCGLDLLWYWVLCWISTVRTAKISTFTGGHTFLISLLVENHIGNTWDLKELFNYFHNIYNFHLIYYHKCYFGYQQFHNFLGLLTSLETNFCKIMYVWITDCNLIKCFSSYFRTLPWTLINEQ